jgi:hypothetical protein
MTSPSIDWKTKRDRLRNKRGPLFENYLKNSYDIRLALEIKVIDDQIAECTEHLVEENKNA